MNRHLTAAPGTVSLLNVAAGDTTLSFDPKNPAERIRAARIVTDMLRRGYCLLVEAGKDQDGKPKYERALEFREDTYQYVIADFDSAAAAEADAQESSNGQDQETRQGAAAPARPTATKADGRGRRRNVSAARTRAVAVAPSAGG